MKIHKYKNIDTWAKAMRKDTEKKLWADWFYIGGHWFTCEEYDSSGRYMRYTSITAFSHLDIDTTNRYSKEWLRDMKYTIYPIDYLRFDLSYYIEDIKELSKKQIIELNEKLYQNKMYEMCKSLLELVVKQ